VNDLAPTYDTGPLAPGAALTVDVGRVAFDIGMRGDFIEYTYSAEKPGTYKIQFKYQYDGWDKQVVLQIASPSYSPV
jgi:hypothetical protein